MFCVSQLLFIIKCQELTKATTVITIKPQCSGLILKKRNKNDVSPIFSAAARAAPASKVHPLQPTKVRNIMS